MFALFMDSLRLVLMGINLAKNRHHLTGSPLTATEREEATLRTDKQCRFISFLLHCGHREHCLPAAFLLPCLDRVGLVVVGGVGATCC